MKQERSQKKSEEKCRVRTPEQNGERRPRLQGKGNTKAGEPQTEKWGRVGGV